MDVVFIGNLVSWYFLTAGNSFIQGKKIAVVRINQEASNFLLKILKIAELQSPFATHYDFLPDTSLSQ